jgi:hypothetical protein
VDTPVVDPDPGTGDGEERSVWTGSHDLSQQGELVLDSSYIDWNVYDWNNNSGTLVISFVTNDSKPILELLHKNGNANVNVSVVEGQTTVSLPISDIYSAFRYNGNVMRIKGAGIILNKISILK